MSSKLKVIWTIKEFTEVLRKRQLNKFDCNIGVSGRRGDGKTQVKGDKVFMSDGSWKCVEDIKVGDEVISPQENGTYSYERVTHIHSRFENEIYDICEATRKERVLYSCAWNHEIPLYRVSSKRIKENGRVTDKRRFSKKLCLKNARQLSEHYTASSHYTGFTCPAIQFKNIKDMDIEPYCLGVWLGDGHFSSKLEMKKNERFKDSNLIKGHWRNYKSGKRVWQKDHYRKMTRCEYLRGGRNMGITSDDTEIIDYVSKYYPVMKIYGKNKTNAKTFRFSINSPFSRLLIKYGLEGKRSDDKFIPKSCFSTSINYRLNLLAGLIDTDGFISKNNQITICTKSRKLSEDIRRLVFSLGGYSLIRNIYKNCQSFKEKRLYYDVAIQFKNPKIIPLKLKRKSERLRIRKIDPTRVAIKSIKRDEGEMVYGFSLTGKSKWYITNNYMVTHNSTLLFKIFNSFKKDGFNANKHQEYSQKAVTELLAKQRFGYCWDDEAINSGYKRDFQGAGQKTLIKVITNYRDNYNIFASALPFFYSLDKDLRELIFVHIHIIERGVGVILLPLCDQIHASDPWDTKENIKIEVRENIRMKKNPELSFRYQKLTTFAGYIYFGPMTEKQEKKYKEIKSRKRAKNFGLEEEKQKLEFIEVIYKLMMDGKLTNDGLLQICLREDKKYSSVTGELSRMLRDHGEKRTPGDFLKSDKLRLINSKSRGAINKLVPSLPT